MGSGLEDDNDDEHNDDEDDDDYDDDKWMVECWAMFEELTAWHDGDGRGRCEGSGMQERLQCRCVHWHHGIGSGLQIGGRHWQ